MLEEEKLKKPDSANELEERPGLMGKDGFHSLINSPTLIYFRRVY
jgi:hypothetical protein